MPARRADSGYFGRTFASEAALARGPSGANAPGKLPSRPVVKGPLVELHKARIGNQKPGKHPQQRCLARTIGANKADQAALTQRKINRLKDGPAAKAQSDRLGFEHHQRISRRVRSTR
jgi:hypothetical protein